MNLGRRYPLDTDIVKLTGCITFCSHCIYYCVWVYVIPQMFDSFAWRLSYSLASIPMIMIDYWPTILRRLSVLYWHLFLVYSLTFAGAYLTLRNEFSAMWMMTDVMVLFTLTVLIDDLPLLFLNLFIGILLAIFTHNVCTTDKIIIEDIAAVSLLPVIFACSILANFTKQKGLAALEKNNALKSLAGSIAHEMRNPLAQIHNNLYLIEQLQKQQDLSGRVFPAVTTHIDHARQVVHSGLQLIDLTMDAISEKPIDPSRFQLLSARNLVQEAVNDYAYEEIEHSQLVSVRGGDFPLMADPVMVKYVVYNLMQNAIWYVKTIPEADIMITIMPRDTGPCCIEVLDTGPGIPANIVPKLFDGFFTAGKVGGTGLGLSYCKRAMNALGGDISCRSELGSYTAFLLFFPQATMS